MVQRRSVNHPIRLLRRHRRKVAAALAAAAVVAGVQAATPAGAQTIPVVVAAHAIPAGTRLAATDLQLAAVSSALVPPDVAQADLDLIGKVTSVAVAGGEPLGSARLLNSALISDPANPGAAPMPLRLSDAGAAALLQPGNRIDILASTAIETAGQPTVARVIAHDVLVLSNLGGNPGGASGFSESSSSGSLVLISASPAQALALAGAAGAGRITFTVVG